MSIPGILYGIYRAGSSLLKAGKAVDVAGTAYARRAITPSKAALRRQAQHPGDPKFIARSPLGAATHRMAEVGQASWGIDSIASRFNSTAPTYMETITVKVYGQRWARVSDLYVLAMTIVVARTNGSLWLGGQAVRCTIDVTGKYVEVEFQQTTRGIAERLVGNVAGHGSPFVLFHNPNWLTNDVVIKGKERAIATIPDVLAPAGQEWINNWAGRDQAEAGIQGLIDIHGSASGQTEVAASGLFTGNTVVNQGPDGSQPGLKLVSHDKDVNPAPLSDGASLGTDLCALVAAALHPPGVKPPEPDTDRIYDPQVAPEPGGCLPLSHRPANGLAGWLERFANNPLRWIRGWKSAKVGGVKPARETTQVSC